MSPTVKYVSNCACCVEYLKITVNCLTWRAVSLTAMWAFQNQRGSAECVHLGQNLAARLGQCFIAVISFAYYSLTCLLIVEPELVW